MRTWTPDTLLDNNSRQISVKRACNGCGDLIGDVTDEEMVGAVRGYPLFDVRPECPRCQGMHALRVTSRSLPVGRTAARDDLSIEVVCPGIPEGSEILPCAAYEPCGCAAPADPYTVEFQEFLKQRCPASPTGEHRHLADSGFVGAPTGGCWARTADSSADAAFDVVNGPGLYAVDVDAFDDTTPVFTVVSLPKVAIPA